MAVPRGQRDAGRRVTRGRDAAMPAEPRHGVDVLRAQVATRKQKAFKSPTADRNPFEALAEIPRWPNT